MRITVTVTVTATATTASSSYSYSYVLVSDFVHAYNLSKKLADLPRFLSHISFPKQL